MLKVKHVMENNIWVEKASELLWSFLFLQKNIWLRGLTTIIIFVIGAATLKKVKRRCFQNIWATMKYMSWLFKTRILFNILHLWNHLIIQVLMRNNSFSTRIKGMTHRTIISYKNRLKIFNQSLLVSKKGFSFKAKNK